MPWAQSMQLQLLPPWTISLVLTTSESLSSRTASGTTRIPPPSRATVRAIRNRRTGAAHEAGIHDQCGKLQEWHRLWQVDEHRWLERFGCRVHSRAGTDGVGELNRRADKSRLPFDRSLESNSLSLQIVQIERYEHSCDPARFRSRIGL